LNIYSDGSGIDGYIKAAAVLYRGGQKKGTLKLRLDSEEHHTVYKGKLVGLGLEVELLQKERNFASATLYADNQAGTRALTYSNQPWATIWLTTSTISSDVF
jgi:hypothetical protein